MKNEDGSVARDVSVNGVPAFFVAALWNPRNIIQKFWNKMNHIIARRIRHPWTVKFVPIPNAPLQWCCRKEFRFIFPVGTMDILFL